MGSTIILADHTEADREDFKNALKGTAYRVVAEAMDRDKMLELATRNKPWCVAVDIELPRGGGAVAIEHLKQALPNVKILCVHASDFAKDVPKAMAAGAHARCGKPYDSARLTAVLKSINVDSTAPKSAESKLIARLKKTLVVHYKGAEDGFFAKKREAMTTEFSLMSVVMQTEEKLSVGKAIVAEIEIPGEAPLKATLNVVKVDVVAGLGRFEVQLTWASMVPGERDRLKTIMDRLIAKKTEAPH